MKRKNITITLGVVLILIISFFFGQPTTKKEDASVYQDVVTESDTPIPTETPEVFIEKEIVPVEERVKEQEKIVVPSEKPLEIISETVAEEKEEIKETDELYCTLSVKCDSVLEKIESLSEEEKRIIPTDGVIYPEQKVIFKEGESVFDILLRELKENNIHLEFVDTPMYDSVYIEGIGNIYEFDFGDLSGWMYRVNGIKPTYGSSQYKVENGDNIEFYYSTNFIDEN